MGHQMDVGKTLVNGDVTSFLSSYPSCKREEEERKTWNQRGYEDVETRLPLHFLCCIRIVQ